MELTRNINLDVDPNVLFEPGMFSIPELHFLVDHLGEPPVAAFHDFDPDGKHKGVMRPRAEGMLTVLYECEELRKHRDIEWAGYKAVKESILAFIEWHVRCQEIRRRGGPANPSMFHWDDTGIAHRLAVGADSAEMVRTQILDDGTRQPFAVRLRLKPEDALRETLSDVAPWIKGKPAAIKGDRLQVETIGQTGNVRCFCGFTQTFQAASDGSRRQAMARMARHLKSAKDEKGRHHLLYLKEYKQ